jgi:hypothetical protein
MSNVGDPFLFGEAVTPSDSVNLSAPSRGLWVGGAGNVSVQMYGDGGTIIYVGVPAGQLLPVQCTRVNATGTTATNIIAGR